MARVKVPPIATRLALREYVPFAATTASWALIGLAIGHADAVRLLGAYTFVQAIRAFFTLEVTQVLSGHIASERKIYRKSRRLALRIEIIGMLVCLAVAAMLGLFLKYRGMEETAIMIGIAALGIPPRHPGGILVYDRRRDVSWRVGPAVAALIGGALIFVFDLNWVAAAIVVALRDWFGLLATWLFGPPKKIPKVTPTEPMAFGHAAARTEASARRRLSYRMMKSLFGVLLGPFGNIAARTGRGVRLDTRIANFIPRNRPGLLLLALGTGGGAAFLLLASREPAAILGSAALARIAASAGSALLWWKYGSDQIDEEEDIDE